MKQQTGNIDNPIGIGAALRGLPLHYLALLASIGFGIAGQLLMKWSALASLRDAASPVTLAGLVLALAVYAVGVANWIIALRGVRLSVAYSLSALNYVGVLAGSALWFGELITPLRVLGVGLVFAGVLLVVLPADRPRSAV